MTNILICPTQLEDQYVMWYVDPEMKGDLGFPYDVGEGHYFRRRGIDTEGAHTRGASDMVETFGWRNHSLEAWNVTSLHDQWVKTVHIPRHHLVPYTLLTSSDDTGVYKVAEFFCDPWRRSF